MKENLIKKDDKKMIGLELDKELYNALVQYAASIGGSISSAVRFILIQHLKDIRKEVK